MVMYTLIVVGVLVGFIVGAISGISVWGMLGMEKVRLRLALHEERWRRCKKPRLYVSGSDPAPMRDRTDHPLYEEPAVLLNSGISQLNPNDGGLSLEEPTEKWESPIEGRVFSTTEGKDALLFSDDLYEALAENLENRPKRSGAVFENGESIHKK